MPDKPNPMGTARLADRLPTDHPFGPNQKMDNVPQIAGHRFARRIQFDRIISRGDRADRHCDRPIKRKHRKYGQDVTKNEKDDKEDKPHDDAILPDRHP